MSQIVDATFKTFNAAGPPSRTGLVPNKKKHLKRFPFLFLIDISGSTGYGADPDINHINDAINQLMATLRSPPAGSELANQIDQVDVCLMTYSDHPTVVIPWSLNTDLPASIQPFKPQTSTGTGAALVTALAYIGTRKRYYRDTENNISCGVAHIIHLTDGAPTDMSIGTALWNEIQSKLSNLNGIEKKRTAILHFVSPNGCVSGNDYTTMQDASGQAITGQQALAKLSGPATVFEMGKEVAAFDALVKMITGVMSRITENYGTDEAAQLGAKQSNGHIKPTDNYGQ